MIDEARAHVAHRAPALEVREVLEFVDPRSLLLEQSKEAAMVVLGSRGRGPVRSMLLGSVAVAVARHASCPVVIHRPMKPGRVRRGILVADDGTVQSRPVLEFAYRQAELTKLPLTVMHCFWDIQSVTTVSYSGAGVDRDTERLELAETVAGLAEEHPDVEVNEVVQHGLPETKVALASDEMDLVVVGAHQGSRLPAADVRLRLRPGAPARHLPGGSRPRGRTRALTSPATNAGTVHGVGVRRVGGEPLEELPANW